MNWIQVTARLKIHEGKLEQFEKAAAACLQSVREKDTGTRQYDRFYNADRTECVVRETYDDSDAILEHIANLGETFGDLLAACDLSLEVFGDPSPELVAASEGLDVTVYSFYQGV